MTVHNFTGLISRSAYLFCNMLILFSANCTFADPISATNPSSNDSPNPPILGMAFPPVQSTIDREFTINELNALNIRHVRIAENWKRRGMSPEAHRFAPLKRRLVELSSAGIDVLLTVQTDAPHSFCRASNKHGCVFEEKAPFEAYLIALLDAVGDDVTAIQFGNEWDNQFAGTTEEYLALHSRFSKIIRTKKPELKIILGGITGRAPYSYLLCERELSAKIPNVDLNTTKQKFCSDEAEKNIEARLAISKVLRHADYDSLDIHLYDFPNLWAEAVKWVAGKSTPEKTIWITEFGGPNPELESQDNFYQAERLRSYMQVASTLEVERVYYFKLTDDRSSYHSASGLFDMNGEKKLRIKFSQ